ncbi:MAG: TIGR03016 family PEP-CTERM system-associated outer membrane protein [Candidatus Accumulibacter sp.]|nr:TIGR03016 family PEP-CTERM system-associated outer membrane protein [Accumulibacter sp.]
MAARYKFPLLPLALGAALGMTPPPVLAGDWRIVPSISVNETSTDNVGLVKNHRKSDWITDLIPGINVTGHGDRLKLDFDYQLHGLFYTNDSSRNNHQNALSAKGTLEALENFFFIDANANITQQNVSAFKGSTYATVDVNDSGNTTETRAYRIAPYFKGMLGDATEYLLRHDLSKTVSDASGANDTRTRQWSGRLASVDGFSRFGWSIEADNKKNDYSRGRDTESELLRGVLTFRVDPQFRVSLIGGREANDYTSENKKSHAIAGAGFEWAPTQRTLLAASSEDRFFGSGNSVTFTHRTAGTAWKYSQTKDTFSSTNQSSGVVGTYFGLLDSMFSTAIPDPAARAAYVNAMLTSSGIAPNATLQGGFMTTGITLQKRKELSLALTGARNTVTFAATRSETQDISRGTGSGWFLGSDFSAFNNVRQTGVSANWAHQLSGLSTLTGSASRLKSKGSGSSSTHTDETMLTVNFLTRLGPKTSAGLGARRIEVDGDTGYAENAVSGTFSHRF